MATTSLPITILQDPHLGQAHDMELFPTSFQVPKPLEGIANTLHGCFGTWKGMRGGALCHGPMPKKEPFSSLKSLYNGDGN